MNTEEIKSILLKMGFVERKDYGNWNTIYCYPQEFPRADMNDSPSIWVSFEDYNNIFYAHFNCHNYNKSVDIEEIKSIEAFLEHLDTAVIWGRCAFIYTEPAYSCCGPAATEQRIRYFDMRNVMEPKPSKGTLDYIEKYGLEPFDDKYSTKYNGKRISDMKWDELAEALIKEIKNKKIKKSGV